MEINTEKNKQIVVRFNKECIEQGKQTSFEELLANHVINHSAPTGMPNGKESFGFFINHVLRKGFSGLQVEILDQIAENDLFTTRKKIKGVHTNEIFGIPPSQKKVEINVIDIIRIQNGQYVEHWGQSNFEEVLKQISQD